MPDLDIRPATVYDAASIAEIYNHYVRSSTATFDLEEKSVRDRETWLSERDVSHPVFVADKSGAIVAWGSLGPLGERGAYRHTVEISAYVAPDARGEGIGSLMSERLIAEARALGHHAIVSRIVHENEASLKMAARLGFEHVGTLREVGRKFDRWLDLVLMEMVLEEQAR